MTVHARQALVTGAALAGLLVVAPAALANGAHDHADRPVEAANAGHGHASEGHGQGGGQDHGSSGHGHPRGDFAAGHPGEPGEVDRTIRIEARDTAFDDGRIEVEPGETIRFVITNTGELVHDFTIGVAATQAAHRAEMAEMMEHHADPEAMMAAHDHGRGNAVMLAPGQTGELIWTFEPASDAEFACNVPGHYEAGMHGDIVVR